MAQHAGRRIIVAEDERLERTGDAGLLEADGLDVAAEPVLVVEVDRGDDRCIGIDQVHRIQPPAEPDFQHRQVELAAREQPQRAQRAVFEIGQRGVAARGLHRFEAGDQCGIVRLRAVDAHALVVAQQVRRGVAADLPAMRAGDGFDEGHGRALAIGAADGDDALGRALQAHPRCNVAHAVQAHVDGIRMLAFDELEPVGQCFRHATL